MSTFCFERYALRGTQPAHVIFIINFNGYTVIVFISGNSVLSPFKFVLFRREIRYASKA